ncbi:Protein SLG1 [Podospora pseudopauciseta]|uniref:Cell wall integrity and stress response protein n=5 Tax=Podospora TaxID=5144 RepID=A0A090CMI5_PODAN|nr:Protein SLG1 [Podospora pseudopauciseta]KAK4675710.1 Protein SLG1 [Podospora pseudoanserina]CDP29645.1 Putative cell wall integrity and stress response protein [Podospora anserina S mat+]VBB81444.1 Putative cell wall integrity and stress response protein [Podospora comata]
MKSIAIFAAALLAVAEAFPEKQMAARQTTPKIPVAVQKPIEDARLNAQTNQGCFKSAGNNMTFVTVIQYNSIGECALKTCVPKGFTAAATTGGNQCWCGYKYPPEDDLVDNKKCDVGCTGFGEEACGGKNYFSVYNTGLTLDVDFAEDSGPTGEKHKTSTTSTTAAPTQVVTLPPSVVTQTQAPVEEEEKKGGKNVAGIVAGVVVGVIAAVGLATGAYLYLRRKRNKEIEEEHRRNAAVSAFIGQPPGSSRGSGISGADSRMDPVMAQRRMSDGSIADNEDYSRKILRVTNA